MKTSRKTSPVSQGRLINKQIEEPSGVLKTKVSDEKEDEGSEDIYKSSENHGK